MDTTTAATASRTRIFRRYANRKFYDPVESRYVKLDDIARVIRSGVEVKVVDLCTRRDVTGVTLARLLTSQEDRTATSADTLRALIRERQEPCGRPEPASADPEEPPAVEAEPSRSPEETLRRVAHDLLNGGHRKVWRARSLLTTTLHALAHLDREARDRADGASNVVASLSRVDVQLTRISRRLDVLYERLRALEAQ